ncbi:hypothetical protein [Actinomadura sp. WMMA1423]|uniref:hypothetical protein n=1 Tax=Actinomadura sp. WMMA1423 TaxID=2591108 RepID=UPI001146E9C8|nr:hypothetical protein [Actinomadura sp. WMMA1423]
MGNERAIRMLGVLAVGGTLLLSAACGSGDTAAGPDKGADPMASFRACLEKQGVDLPDGGNAPGGVPPSARPSNRPSGAPGTRPSGAPTGSRPSGAPTDRPTRSAAEQKAMRACASLAPKRGNGGGREAPPAPPEQTGGG